MGFALLGEQCARDGAKLEAAQLLAGETLSEPYSLTSIQLILIMGFDYEYWNFISFITVFTVYCGLWRQQ